MSQPRLRMRRQNGTTVKVGANTFRRSGTATPNFQYYTQGFNYGGVTILPGFYPVNFSMWEIVGVDDGSFCDTDVDIAEAYSSELIGSDEVQLSDEATPSYEAPTVIDYGYNQPDTSYQQPAPEPAPVQETYQAPAQQVEQTPAQQSGGGYTPSDSTHNSGGFDNSNWG